jgi:hypothetical protein
LPANSTSTAPRWRIVVVGGHTRSIGKTQLVCDIIRAFPQTPWIAGKITQYGHGVCAQNGENCDCAPDQHICAINWESHATTGTDSSRFLAAGARRSFWLRTKQGFLAEAMPVLRRALQDAAPATTAENEMVLIVESNSLLQFVKPSLYFAVIDPVRNDFKESAQVALDRADVLVLRGDLSALATPAPLWMSLPARLVQRKPSVYQREGESLPEPLCALIQRVLDAPAAVEL